MRTWTCAVLGAGPAGLATALALARDGHRVVLIERDAVTSSDPDQALRWNRRGIPHFLQPHALIPRGRKELKDGFPDVYDRLVAQGAYDVDLRLKLPGEPAGDDEDLQYVGVRRPLIEWALRESVLAEQKIDLHAPTNVTGLRGANGRVEGIVADGAVMDADVIVDAMGRRSPLADWLDAIGGFPPETSWSECGVIYYSRYYRIREGKTLPDGPWILSPRGDLGYMGFASFPGDNNTFAALLAVPPGVPEMKIFRETRAFEAGLAQIPMIAQWTEPGTAEPITSVLPMGSLQNTIHEFDDPPAPGVFPTGDALCHTDPVLAHGLAFALIHAQAVARSLREHDDLDDASRSYFHAVTPALRERYALATALDEQRLRLWTGGKVDLAHHDGDYALFSIAAAGAVAITDPVVFRAFVRRVGLLDGTRVLDDDIPLQERIEKQFLDLLAEPRMPLGPPRDEMLHFAAQAIRD